MTDHSKSVIDFRKMGVSVWQPYTDNVRLRRFGNFSVQAFQVPHDNMDCYGFYIKVDGQKMLYVTDFEYVPVSFRKIGIQHLLIECNYQNKYVEKSASNREHVLRGHAELQTTLVVVKDNANSLKNVILCHISNGNGNPYEMVKEVQKYVKNANVDFAEKGKEFSLTDECPF